jgi:hypothetical protein
MASSGTPRELTLRGIVIPTDWDHRGVARQVAILTADEEEYEVSEDGIGRQLLKELREEVEVRVRIDEVGRLQRLVTVLSYTVLDTFDPDNELLTGLLRQPNDGGW